MSGKHDTMPRGVKRPSPLGTTLFVGLRTLDVFIQYGILARGLADPLLAYLPASSNSAPTVALGLPLKPLIVLGMAAGAAVKQIYWVLFIAQEEMPSANALPIGIANVVFNSPNSIFSMTALASYFTPIFLTAADEQTGLSPLFLIGTVMYVLGITTELLSEIQRKQFKKNPKNAGKLYTSGLFSLARNINLGGYALMRSGWALAAGGWIWGSVIATFFFGDFASRAVPILDQYCTEKYTASWAHYKNKVTYKLIPGIY